MLLCTSIPEDKRRFCVAFLTCTHTLRHYCLVCSEEEEEECVYKKCQDKQTLVVMMMTIKMASVGTLDLFFFISNNFEHSWARATLVASKICSGVR